MKRTVLVGLCTLIAGFAIGVFFKFHMFPITSATPMRSTMNAVAAAPSDNLILAPAPAPASSQPPLDREDNLLLLARAGEALEAIKARDYQALAQMVHPEKGVTFTPYSTVDPDGDLCFTADQIALAAGDTHPYIWGVTDGKGEPIELTVADYFDQFVFNADYTRAPQIGVDTVLASGNALENVSASFPGARFVEFHYSGLDPASLGYDWCSLKLVFEAVQDQWMLVGLIHSEWTI